MHVLMLGWEFPPFITGGLGTACYGLTRAMSRRGLRVTFVLPKAVSSEEAEHVSLVSPQHLRAKAENAGAVDAMALRDAVNARPGDIYAASLVDEPLRDESDQPGAPAPNITPTTRAPGAQDDQSSFAGGDEPPLQTEEFEHVEFVHVPAIVRHPYPQREPGPVGAWITSAQRVMSEREAHELLEQATSPEEVRQERIDEAAPMSAREPSSSAEESASPTPDSNPAPSRPAPASDYGGDMFEQAERYADFCVRALQGRPVDFDVIHAHDWMTYPAGLAIARRTGKPLVVHLHSSEFDRSGVHVNQRIYDIERRGMHGAMRVITVSQLTKNVAVHRYSVPAQKIEVVYNGVDIEPRELGMQNIESRDKIVLYFGRITYQKGPEYFIRAAQRVLEIMDDVKFVVAGSGDMARRMIEMAAELGIGHKVLFTGFLRGKDIQRVFSLANLYVMPSVSEPFGIAPLEALSHEVPVLISKSSGVSEVLQNALKVDFWDIDDMANKIIAVLRHPPLGRMLIEHGTLEVRRLTWDGAAERCEQIYQGVVEGMHAVR